MKALRISFTIIISLLSLPLFALDASEDGDWISMGYPKHFHMGTDGRLYITGSNHGSCSGAKPTYFRVNMDDEHFDKLSLLSG